MSYRSFMFDFKYDHSSEGSHNRMSSQPFDRRGKAFEYYLRGWLPLDKRGRIAEYTGPFAPRWR